MFKVLTLILQTAAYIFTAYIFYGFADKFRFHAKVFKRFAKQNPRNTLQQFNLYLALCYVLTITGWLLAIYLNK